MTIEHTTRRTWTVGLDEQGALCVTHPNGRRWYPSLSAESEASGCPIRLARLARTQPDRGMWV